MAAQNAGDFDGMLRCARKARNKDPRDTAAGLRLAECYLLCGQVPAAIPVLEELERQAANDPLLLQQIGERYTQCSKFALANRCYRRAVEIQPDDAGSQYNLAASCIALGRLKEAEQLLDEVILLSPTDYDAWQNRSTLRRQTPENNHVRRLQSVLQQLSTDDPGRAPVLYALAKELEDLQRFDQSFSYLQQGAMSRREQIDYDVGNDIATMEQIQQTFTSALLRSGPAACDSPRPIFVMGLPRSGTTLVDRIVSAHSQAASLGEINSLTQHHLDGCPSYKRIWPEFELASRIEDVPYLHVELFKHQDLKTEGAGIEHGRTLKSSATSSGVSSRITLDSES